MIPHVGYKNDKRCRCRHLIASFAWVEDGIGYYADKSAPFNAFPLCSPQGHYQAALRNKLLCHIFCPPYALCMQACNAVRMTKGVVADTLLLRLLGWKMGFEPTTLGTTILYSNRLSYIHHLICFPNRCANIHTFFVSPKFSALIF